MEIKNKLANSLKTAAVTFSPQKFRTQNLPSDTQSKIQAQKIVPLLMAPKGRENKHTF